MSEDAETIYWEQIFDAYVAAADNQSTHTQEDSNHVLLP